MYKVEHELDWDWYVDLEESNIESYFNITTNKYGNYLIKQSKYKLSDEDLTKKMDETLSNEEKIKKLTNIFGLIMLTICYLIITH